MDIAGWIQLALFSVMLLLLTKPMGLYLVQVLDTEGRTWLDPALKPVERLIYRVAGIDPAKEQDWRGYAVSVLIFSLVTLLLTYVILRLQAFLPFNPQGFGGVAGDLSFNTAASFTTNTNWQNYGGESTMSYLSQMVALAIQNFFSAAAGHRRRRGPGPRHRPATRPPTLGNFWVRSDPHLSTTCCFPSAWCSRCFWFPGMIQNFKPYDTAKCWNRTPPRCRRWTPAVTR